MRLERVGAPPIEVNIDYCHRFSFRRCRMIKTREAKPAKRYDQRHSNDISKCPHGRDATPKSLALTTVARRRVTAMRDDASAVPPQPVALAMAAPPLQVLQPRKAARHGEAGRSPIDCLLVFAWDAETEMITIQAASGPSASRTVRSRALSNLQPIQGMQSSLPVTRDGASRRYRQRVTLCEVGECHMMSFLPAVPDRLKVEAVCKRWRHLSHQIPIEVLEFDAVARRSVSKRALLRMLERADRNLTRLSLPNVRIEDAHMKLVFRQSELRCFQAHRWRTARSSERDLGYRLAVRSLLTTLVVRSCLYQTAKEAHC